jgi:Spy/CpxP family protein refolding chaperone
MKRRKGAIARKAIAAVCFAASLAAPALAQGHGGPPGGGMGGPGMGGPQFPNGGAGSIGIGGGRNQPRVQASDSRAGLVLGPPGVRWWDNHSFAKSMKLRPDQQMKMDAIFEQNRGALISSFEGVREAEAQMEQLTRASSPDEAALFAQIDRVAQARAELAKTTTHMFLQIRKEMDPDQLKQLEKASQR